MAADNLRMALRFLQQPDPPEQLRDPAAVLEFATRHWCLEQVPGVTAIGQATLGLPD